jgi:hypothetical protein
MYELVPKPGWYPACFENAGFFQKGCPKCETAHGEPNRYAFWFSEFGAKPQTPPKDAAKSKPWSGFDSRKG